MSEQHKKPLQSQFWNIANTLRGKMGADEFRDYILDFIFYASNNAFRALKAGDRNSTDNPITRVHELVGFLRNLNSQK